MPALSTGTEAPDFSLNAMDGSKFSLSEALKSGPVLLAFFKISCPVCQFTFPYIERLYQAFRDRGVRIVGVSQNNEKDTQAFLKEYGVTFPVVMDDPESYPVSNAYGLTNVPTLFWVAPDGEIEISTVGWNRKDMEEINERFAANFGVSEPQLFRPKEDVPEYRPG
jgi:peroxiredoxin